MRSLAKTAALSALLGGAATLSACGGLMDNEAMYQEFASTCTTSFTAEGGPAEMAKPFCDCSTAKVREQELGPMDFLDEEKMTAIGEECGQEVADTMLGA
ncbi:hypothetical protein [Erythrobacter sp. F6033]|uniref:hypothetical protein n=1 Tax=Erythrobacter sp. F6033 TaxID=2926401 RepID=UPI001FF550B8|nr:hypothetical protein [Erythrobacter sp. F6033]MCK0128054.1 hypothetical protein [Erythrobacter sp. F6033]